MSFFKKLKSKLFRSSSRIEEGIDAIVENEDSEAENNLLDDEDKTGQQLETEVFPEPEPGNLNLCNLILYKVKDFNKAHSHKIRSDNSFK